MDLMNRMLTTVANGQFRLGSSLLGRPHHEYYDLISAFSRRRHAGPSQHQLNENEPIVDTPAQAVDCFVRNDMDVLCLGPFVSAKQGAD
jgi:predicted NodU family carbamoyl transferase